MDATDLSGALSAARHEAVDEESAVTAVVDGSGQVVEIRVEAKAMRLDAERLGQALTGVVRTAQAAARGALPDVVGDGPATSPDTESLTRLASELGAGAQQRLADISSTLEMLLSRGTGPGTEV